MRGGIRRGARKAVIGTAAAIALLCSVAASQASAVNRFASPTGTGSAPCTISSPTADACPLTTALANTVSGDDVTLLGGSNYPSQTGTVSIPSGSVVHGAPGAPVTIQSSTTNNVAVDVGGTLRDVRFIHTGGLGQAALLLQAGALAERVLSQTTNPTACRLSGGLIRDSVCHNGSNDAVAVTASGGGTVTATLRNVTAYAPLGYGVRANTFGLSSQAIVHATNVIALGDSDGDGDVGALTDGGAGAAANVILDHSNYDATDEVNGTVTDPGTSGNVTTTPVFVNPGTANFDQQPTSTGTIDLGTAATVNGFGLGSLDLGGGPRCAGTAPDIGADELTGSACPVPPTPPVTTPTAPKKCKKGKKLKKGKCVKKKRKRKKR